MPNLFTDIINFFINFIAFLFNLILDNLLYIEIVSFLVTTVLLILIIYFLSKTNILGEEVEHLFNVFGKIDIVKKRHLKAWKEIQKKLKSGNIKPAILDADRILNDILKMANFTGKNLDERLELIDKAQLSNIEEIRQAHKIRNRIYSESDFVITQNEAEVIIDIYKKTFQELNLIEE